MLEAVATTAAATMMNQYMLAPSVSPASMALAVDDEAQLARDRSRAAVAVP
jgi:hypothetical protein